MHQILIIIQTTVEASYVQMRLGSCVLFNLHHFYCCQHHFHVN